MEIPASDYMASAIDPGIVRPSRAGLKLPRKRCWLTSAKTPIVKACSTPRRMIEAYDELFQGYAQCPAKFSTAPSETAGYDDFVLMRDIAFHSHCEHHVMPFYGKAHIAYAPVDRVVGLSKLARLVDAFAHRLQTQEHLTAQVAGAINAILKPRGVAVVMEAEHTCMSVRGIAKKGALTLTSRFTGIFHDNPEEQARFLNMVRGV